MNPLTRHVVVTALAASAVVVPTSIPSTVVEAAGSPDVVLTKSMPGEVLYGDPITATLTANTAVGETVDGYNLSFTDTLPEGAIFAGSDPAPSQIIDLPGPNGTAIVWENVADLLAGASVSLSYTFTIDETEFDIGEQVVNSAGAYVSSNPREIPDFDPATGANIDNAQTDGSDTATASTTLIPFELTKTSRGDENELLRGVQDHKSVFTLTVDNNQLVASSGFTLVDYLPAGLEFLECGDVDNSSPGEEYPGSGRIDAGPTPVMTNPCPLPTSVTTVTDPVVDGTPLPAGVYTRVAWDAATLIGASGTDDLTAGGLGTGGSFSIDYAAGIPLRENVQASLGDTAANLDNNTGPLTYDEQELVNHAFVDGTTDGIDYSDTDTAVVTAEDLSIHKSTTSPGILQGASATWEFVVESSEYNLSTDTVITVTDIIPNGLEYDSTDLPLSSGPTLGPVGGGAPDGTQIVEWELPAFTDPNGVVTWTMSTLALDDYRAPLSGPVSANDAWSNTVMLEAEATIITDNDGSSTPSLPVPDESAASQAADAVTIRKEVAEPAPATVTCGNGAASTFTEDIAYDYRAGDRVCWRLTVEFPGGLDTLTPLVKDYLPDGYTYESWALGQNNDFDAADVDFKDDTPADLADIDEGILVWDLADAESGKTFEVVVSTILTGGVALSNADITRNLMKFSYQNTATSLFQARSDADARYVEPILSIAKGHTPSGRFLGGDTVDYTVTVTNQGFLDAENATVTDDLPAGITCDDVSLGALVAPAAATCPSGNSTITWTGIDVDAATEQAPVGSGIVSAPGSTPLTYTVLLPITLNPNSSLTNTATLVDYQTSTNTGTPVDWTPSGLTATDTIQVVNATISKARTTGTSQTGNSSGAQATIGETITYTVTATLPGGTTTTGGVITDTMPAGIRLDTATVTLNGGAAPGTFASNASGFTLTLPSPYTNNSGNDVFVFTLQTTVTDVPGNDHGDSPVNTARLDWSAGSRTANATTNLVEPTPAVAKANDTGDDLVVPGEFVEYTLTVSTTGSAANDVVIVDTLPDDVIPLVGPGPAADVADGGTVASGGEWDLGTRTITWDAADIAALETVSAGSPVDLVYDTRINNPLTGDIRLTNNVALTATSMPGVDPDERTYTASATDTVTAPSISVITKTANPTTATVGDTVDYTVTVGIPADVIGYDLTILDDLPAGTEYESLISVSCSEPAAAPCAPARSASALSADGDTGTIGFYVGDINPGSNEAQTITLVYRVRVLDDDTNVVAPDDLDNSARSLHNITDKIAGTPTGIPAGPFDNESDDRVGTVRVVEPTLVIDKDIAGQTGDSDTRRHQPGDTATFTVRVENTGTSPAYDVVVTDTPDSRLTGFTPAAGVSTSALTDGDPSDGTLGWFIAGPIQPGAGNAITLTYTLDIPNTLGPADEVVSGFEVTNTADIPQYFGHPEATRTANPTIAYREYGTAPYDVTPDTVNIELDLARIGDRVWYDINGDGVQDPGEPGLNGVDITVTYLGPNGVIGGGDDEIFTTATSGDGDWQVIELPGGDYVVDVDGTDVPAGMSPSWDLDDLLASPDGDWAGTLAQNGDRDDVDAGFTGSGSIGNLVWFDQDLLSGQNGNEPGLDGIDVTLVWGGPDGDLLTVGDNITYTTTTAGGGAYLFDQLPAGDFQVTVDGSDLPAGMSFVTDPDTGAPDGVSLVTLDATGPGVDDLDQDFGVAGPYQIGDTIYLDRDGSGEQALTGEPGLEGVTVTLTYAGADGILGGAGAADDIVFTDVTDVNGEYLFENLPPEDYRVTVVGPLPSGSVNSDDPDTVGTGDSTSVVALTADDLDQDFGYSADSEIGDRVWWDLDRDGVQDAGEPGINGAAITVTYLGPDGLAGGGDDLVFTTTTSGDGDWSITNIPDGEYTVAVTAGIPAGFDETFDDDGIGTPSTSSTTLTTLDDDQDFGYAGNSSIGDTIWLDRNGDGAMTGDETGIPDVTVTVTWAGPDGDLGTTGDNEVFTRVTDDDGLYSVVGLPAGTYEVAVDETTLPDNVSVTYDVVNGATTPSSTAVVTLGTAEDLDTVDFGYQGDSSIGDTIYWDRNGDGDQDTPGDSTDEPGLEGVTVELVWAGPDGDLLTTDDNATYTTLTDSDGNYLFGGLPEGEYEVNVTAGLPAGMTNTDDEDDDNDSSTPVTLGAADDHDTADFGYNGSATIGDTIYLDLDGNADQAATGEPGVPGQTVTLNFEGADGTLGTPDDIVFTTVTDANGEYEFTNLPDGEFRVTVVGGITDDASNSEDPDGATPNQSDVVIAGGVDDLEQDFGYEGDNALGDTIWWDMNRDGVIDPAADEPRLAGVDVRITYAGADGILGGAGAADDIVISTETTGAAGDYSVDRLPNGDYSVEVITSTLPAGMDNTYDADGGTTTPNDVSFVNLPGATTNDDQDFGYAGTGSIGDLVYFDRDGDGIRGAPLDEPGIAGVEVTLTFAGADGILGGAGAADDIVVTQIAGPDGEYDFTGLPAGEYTVEVTNGIPTTAVNSDDPDLSGEPDVGDSSSSVTLTAGEDNNAQDFGYDVEAGLGDRVWWDFDRDGVQDDATPGSPREPGINGVEVTVTYFGLDGVRDLPGDPDPDDEVFVTTTSGDGNWMVNDIPEGNYAIELTDGLPAGFTNTYDPDTGLPGADGNAELAGHTGLNVAQDFGLAGDSSIGDTVWLDLDGDGTINGQEVGLEGVTVNLTWGGPDGIVGGANGADDVVIAVVTDANGNYSFEGLPAGEYLVAVDPASLPDGLTPSFDLDGDITTPDGSTPVTLGAAEDIDTVDFGYQGSSSIGDTIFFDRDRDGTQQVGGNGDEPGLAGVVVTLTWEGENGIFGDADDEMFTTFTNADGFYEFTGLPAGEFQVDVDTTPTGGLPVAVTNTVDEDGNNNSSTPVTLGVDDVHDTTDFGYAGVASIGDTIFIDLDGDGEQTGDEPGVPGQTVTLTGDQGTFTTVTNADGMYSFDNLPDGDYTVTVVGGIVDTAVNTGDPDNAVGAGDSTAAVTISGGISNDEQDFGYQGTAGLGDTLYFDVDNDGVDDGAATEPRLDGVDVVVVWFGPDGQPGGGDDVIIPTDPTNADGVYGVTGLPAGTYSVTPDPADIIPGLTPTVDADGGSDGTSTITLADGVVDLDQDFAYTGTGSIGDTVWLDLNDDGLLDEGEPGLEGVTVTVTWLGPDGVAGGDDDVVYTTTVADDGSYLIEDLPAGEFTVVLSGVPDGVTGATSSTTNLDPGEADVDQDFPFVGSASVGDTVFLDVDDDGVQGTGEPGVGGVTVTVTSSGSDGVLGTDDDLVIVTTTAPDGTYTVTGLPAGPTQVAIDPGTLLPGTVPTSDADGGDPGVSTIDLETGENDVDQDFAIAGDGAITGTVIDEGDGSGIPDVTITITYTGPDGPIVIITTSGPDGEYEVTGLPVGDYTVEILTDDQPDGYIPTAPTSVDVTVTASDPTPPNVDFPFVEPGSIGRTIFIDMNNNGVQDAGEGGAAGVTVTLLDADGNVVATMETDEDGNFVFENLPPGTYTVVLDPDTFPRGLALTVDPDGTNDGRFVITIGPGEDSRAAVFGLAPPVLPKTGSGIGVLLRMAALLLAAGAVLMMLRRRRDDDVVTMKL